MKKHKIKFIKKSILFSLILFFLLFVINQAYINFVFNKKNLVRNQGQLEEVIKKNNTKILFFGDSHAARSINPEYIPNSFNYAIPGESYEQTYYKVKWIVSKHPSVETFVLPIDFHSFSNFRNYPYYDIKHWTKFISYKELAILTDKPKINILIFANFPIIGKGWEIFRFIKNNGNQTEMSLGWLRKEASFASKNNLNESGIRRVNAHLYKYPIIKEKSLTNPFYKTIRYLNDNDKKIILIKYPVTKEYINAIEKKGVNESKFYSDILNTLSPYKNIYIIDYQQTYKDETKLFSDSDHLNYKGAEIFSKKINEEIKKIKNGL